MQSEPSPSHSELDQPCRALGGRAYIPNPCLSLQSLAQLENLTNFPKSCCFLCLIAYSVSVGPIYINAAQTIHVSICELDVITQITFHPVLQWSQNHSTYAVVVFFHLCRCGLVTCWCPTGPTWSHCNCVTQSSREALHCNSCFFTSVCYNAGGGAYLGHR